MKPRVLLTLILPLCLVSLALADDQADLKELESGSWRVVGIMHGGMETPKEIIEKSMVSFTFKGEKLTLSSGGETKEGTFKIDSSKTPKEMEVKVDKDTDKGIYQIEKESLKLAIGKKERPKDFKGGADNIVFSLERAK